MTADDDAVWNYAKHNGLVIASKDNDFLLRSLLYGHPPKVVLIAKDEWPDVRIEILAPPYEQLIEGVFGRLVAQLGLGALKRENGPRHSSHQGAEEGNAKCD
jgi:hypothetical protein